MNNKLALFEETKIRKVYKNNKWYYSITDVISLLTDSSNPNQCLKNIKSKDLELEKNWNNLCINLNMQTKDGKIRKTMTSDTIGILRIIESIHSERAEKFKMWLARLGSERLEEINNPKLIMDRMKQVYELKGYSSIWIEQREREIVSRHSLKEEWNKREIKTDEYKILTNEIYNSSFGIDINKYKDIKGINDINCLKDSMTNLELALTNLSEIITIETHRKNNSKSLNEIKKDINDVGKIINKTKLDIENNLGRDIISSENYMNLTNQK